MDPLTTLLAAAAATGPNTFQSQALTALRSAGPQESYFTRMGNPHPLQMQQLGQPTAPQLNPIITHPVSAPTALAQQIPMPILPLTHPMAEPATTGLHIPTLQAIHRMQQQAGPAPTMMPTMPQTPTVQPPAALPRDPTEYTQANFPRLPQDSWPCWLSWRCRISKHCAAAHTTSYSLAIRQEQGDLRQAQARATHSPPAGDRTGDTAPPSSATHSTTKGETDAPSALQRPQQEPLAATAPTSPQVQKPPPGPTIPQPQSARTQAFILQPLPLASCQCQTHLHHSTPAPEKDSVNPPSHRWRQGHLRPHSWI